MNRKFKYSGDKVLKSEDPTKMKIVQAETVKPIGGSVGSRFRGVKRMLAKDKNLMKKYKL